MHCMFIIFIGALLRVNDAAFLFVHPLRVMPVLVSYLMYHDLLVIGAHRELCGRPTCQNFNPFFTCACGACDRINFFL